ncbi:hypothetical protein ABID19_005115 [Mesorhizobium robiniae]|uniref:Uncharacterized protein n=1 Tax=Mesorhizobium robiniae TaxID=559315 RepID=A0ABV2GUV2_9HYPH
MGNLFIWDVTARPWLNSLDHRAAKLTQTTIGLNAKPAYNGREDRNKSAHKALTSGTFVVISMSKRTPDLKPTKQTLLRSSELPGFAATDPIPPRMLALAKRLQEALQQHVEQARADNWKSRSRKGR